MDDSRGRRRRRKERRKERHERHERHKAHEGHESQELGELGLRGSRVEPGSRGSLGSRVVVDLESHALHGVLLYLGPVHGLTGTWAGVHLDEPAGNCDGSFRSRRYFTAPPDHGLLVPPSSVSIAVTSFHTTMSPSRNTSPPTSTPVPVPVPAPAPAPVPVSLRRLVCTTTATLGCSSGRTSTVGAWTNLARSAMSSSHGPRSQRH